MGRQLGVGGLSGASVTKEYVDAIASGLTLKDNAKAATTANITLSGTQTIDDVALIAGDRVLVKNQTSGAENGIYDVAAGAWARSSDANVSAEVTSGMFCFVTGGTVNGSKGFALVTADPIVLDTTVLVFAQFSGTSFTAGNGLTLTGAAFAIDTTITADLGSVQTFTGVKTFGTAPKLTGLGVGDLLVGGASEVFAKVPDVAVNQVLVSGGVGVAPSYSATPRIDRLGIGIASVQPLHVGAAAASYRGFGNAQGVFTGGASNTIILEASSSGVAAAIVHINGFLNFYTNPFGTFLNRFSINETGGINVTPSANVSNSLPEYIHTGAAHTNRPASTEVTSVRWNLARTVQWATGNFATQREVRFQAPTYGFVGASVVTECATVSVSGPPIPGTNATLTNVYAWWVESGLARLVGSYSLPAAKTQTTVGATGGATVLPALPLGYFMWTVDGVEVVSPYYNKA